MVTFVKRHRLGRKRLILHIGAPKCGSTYLQRVMLGNRDLLAKHGILYPHADDGRSHAGNAGRIHTQIDSGKLSNYFKEVFFKKRFDTVFLSHEDLFERPQWGSELPEWARAEGVVLTIFAFLRPYNEIIFGTYSQYMKQYFEAYLADRKPYGGMKFREFALDRFRRTNYLLAATTWNDIAHPSGLKIHHYRSSREVVESHIGRIDGMNWSLDKKLSNVSLRVADCDKIADAIRDPRCSEQEIRDLLQRAYENSYLPDPGRSEARIAWLEDLHADRNETIAREFGYNNFRSETQ